MSCPVCEGDEDVEKLALRANVTVFACPRCAPGVLRAYATPEDGES